MLKSKISQEIEKILELERMLVEANTTKELREVDRQLSLQIEMLKQMFKQRNLNNKQKTKPTESAPPLE